MDFETALNELINLGKQNNGYVLLKIYANIFQRIVKNMKN